MRLISLVLISVCRSIYEREVGHFDWKLSLIGKPLAGSFNPKIDDGIIVSTEIGIVSTLTLRSGEILWKSRAFQSSNRIVGFLVLPSGDIVVRSSNEIVLLDSFDGSRKWTLVAKEVTSVQLCDEGTRMKLLPDENVVHAADGSPAAGSHGCVGPKSSSIEFPLSFDDYEIRADAGHVFECLKKGKQLWTREEALASVSSMEVVSRAKTTSTSTDPTRDLEWLMGDSKRAVLFSPRAQRLLFVDVSTGKVVKALDNFSSKVFEIRKRFDGKIELLDKKRVPVGAIDPWTGLPASVDQSINTVQAQANVYYEIKEESGEVYGRRSQNSKILWRINLRGAILHVIRPSHSELENVPVLVKGDSSIVFKYMNPNLLILISERMGASGDSDGIVVSALDSVTGALVHQTVVPGASRDKDKLHFVQCDNWIVGHYWSGEFNRFEVIAIDLFDNRPDPGFVAAATGAAGPAVDSAYQLPVDPVALVQQFVFPLGPVTAVAVTGTLQGISPRQVLFATTSGIFAIRKDTWLNPRRPHARVVLPERLALVGDEASSLPPYVAVLPVNPTDFVSHMHVIEKIKKVITVPTHLESTCLAFALGDSEIFAAPVYPGDAPYDVLSPYFNYWLLGISVATVAVSVMATSVLASRKQLYIDWK